MTENHTDTNPIKSLKRNTHYNSMLALVQHEKEIVILPLKKKKTMEITNLKLSIHNSKKFKSSILMSNVRSITAQKKDKIRIQFYERKVLSNGITIFKRKYVDYSLEKNDFSATHICKKIQKEVESPDTKSTNRYGFLMMQEMEHIIEAYPNIKTNKGIGLLYITNVGVYLETDEGVEFDVSYDHISLITDHKKKVRILWQEPWNSRNNFKFDFEMNKKLDSNVIRIQIQNAFSSYRKKIGHEFIQLDQRYSKLSYDEMFSLVNVRNPEFKKYLQLHVNHTFGSSTPNFDALDLQDLLSCKLLGYDLELIRDISEEEKTQRKESLEFFTQLTKYNKKQKELYDVQLEMESTCKDKDSFIELRKSKKYINILSALDDLKNNPEISTLDTIDDFEEKKLIHTATALRAHDKRTISLYQKWSKDVPLIKSEDEYDSAWMNHLIQQLNCEHGLVETFGSTITLNDLQDGMKIRDRNVTTLSSFVKPEDIADEDIYNNCWHDRTNKIWYVYDDNLDERLKEQAISDPDLSQGMLGRRVWGFGEDQVVMFAGFPSIVLKGSAVEEDTLDSVTCDRETGINSTYLSTKMRSFILPILKETDITEELMNSFGSFTLQTEAMLYCIGSEGGREWMTPQMHKFYTKKYNLAEIAIAERVRRAIFASKTGGWFYAKTPLQSNYE